MQAKAGHALSKRRQPSRFAERHTEPFRDAEEAWSGP